MDNTLVLCGGTGAHVGLALLRLHTLGYALGFFDHQGKPFDFPRIFLVDQDAGPGRERQETAWQLARDLVARHPGAHDWNASTGSALGPELLEVTPLPVGPQQDWYKPPYSTLASRYERSPLLPALASGRQRQIDYSKGMMGSPAIGSLLFRLKQYDERGQERNHDQLFGQLLARQGRIVVAGSGVGGTGAAVGPTLARRLATSPGSQVMAVMVLNWFRFIEDQSEVDEDRRAKAQLRNRVMSQNANSAFAFYGDSLAREVAAVPVGMPERSLIRRAYTGDLGQPSQESYIHAVAAQCAVRHFLAQRPYGPGLYAMGAVESGRLDGRTAIPGGTLQDLANQAATVSELLALWQRVLASGHHGHVTPALYDAVAAHADPPQVADDIGALLANYRAQLAWMGETLAVTGTANRDLTRESESRRRLLGPGHRALAVTDGASPAAVAAALFDWTAHWVRDIASPSNGLRLAPGEAHGSQWPDLRYDGIGVGGKANGDLARITDANIALVLGAFVEEKYLAGNGWPHPLAAADFFDHALRQGGKVALRQLELLLCGLAAGDLELRPLAGGEPPETALSLENLVNDYRRQRWIELAEHGVFLREGGGARLIGFNSPRTLLCPVPRIDDEDDALWQALWEKVSEARDGARWDEAISPASWGSHDLPARQVRSWIALQKQVNPGTAPAWAMAFQGYADQRETPFLPGPFLPVYWESGGTPQVLRLSLPIRGSDDNDLTLPPGTQPLEEAELLERVPELVRVLDSSQREFFRFELRLPDGASPVRVWWDEHLDELRRTGRVAVCGRTRAGALLVVLRKNGVMHGTILDNSLVLRRSDVVITTCTPFYQDPLPGSPNPAGERFPDIPLRPDYLDLVKFPDGSDVLGRIATGGTLESPAWRPSRGRDSQGRPKLTWVLPLKGRGQPMTVEIVLASETPAEKLHRAHFMVWPHFRTLNGAGWRAYYLYERCSDPRLLCDTLWFEAAADRLRRRPHDGTPYPYPLSYRTGSNAAHTGGPPLALALRNVLDNEDQGLYLVQLKVRGTSDLSIALGIDFGTSHSVAAVLLPGKRPQQVRLLADLDRANAAASLTLHVCEDQALVHETYARAGILANASWLPTYRERGEGILPSELLLLRTLQESQAERVETWQPVRDFTIPPMDIVRSNLSEHVLTDFKWDAGSEFRGREGGLREQYLGLFFELVMAEVIDKDLPGVPTQPVDVTFTYPLRSGETQYKALGESLARVLSRANASLGLQLQLRRSTSPGDAGRFDESRAAQVPTHHPGEVCLVADLGGGTLDLFIAPYRPPAAGAQDAGQQDDGAAFTARLLDVADSVRVGGNLVLRHIAEHAERYLPRDGGWLRGDVRTRETGLRAWMRSRGSDSLFGFEKGDGLTLADMELRGFSNANDAGPARELLDRYFRLIVEYLARNLTAYLVKHWLAVTPAKHHQKLRISVQLRGNGWRLWYRRQSYVQITQAIQDDVRQRLMELWPLVDGNPYPAPSESKHWLSADLYPMSDPKPGPVKNVVGKAMSYAEVTSRWFTHTLTDLEALRNGDYNRIAWYSRVPFDTGATRQVQLETITPPLLLSGAKEDRKIEIGRLEADLQGRVNSALQQEGQPDGRTGMFLAPVAPLVWEAVFDSRQFWRDGETG